MCKTKKTEKIQNRLKPVREEVLFKLYNNLPYECQSCVYSRDCEKLNSMNDTMTCDLYSKAYELNELIEMLKEQNVHIGSFCEKYNLKREFFMDMIKGKALWKFRYYYSLLRRLHIIEDEEFEKCKIRFEECEFGNNDSVRECEDR